MNKKLVYPIIIILIIIMGIYAILAFNSTYNAKVGSSSVSIPDGYQVTNTTDTSATLKDNKTTFKVSSLDKSQTIDQIIEQYKETHQNQTIKDYNKTIGDVNLIGVLLQNSKNKTSEYNYYYEKNYKIYHIYEKGKHNQTALEMMVNTTTVNPIPFV